MSVVWVAQFPICASSFIPCVSGSDSFLGHFKAVSKLGQDHNKLISVFGMEGSRYGGNRNNGTARFATPAFYS